MLDVLIISYNESLNIPHTVQALQGWTNRVFVVDSGSTDGTQEIARELGAEVVHHDWEGYARQKNWALDNLPFEAPWILIVDSDEVITPKLREEIEKIVSQPVDEVTENGFFINRLSYFMDRPIRHCGYFPSWNMRLFKRDKGRYEDRSVHEHIVIDDPLGYIYEPMIHNDRRGLEHFFAKHNRYSTLEATELFREITHHKDSGVEANITEETRRRRWLKRHLIHRLPFVVIWRFLYMYVIRLGFLDGRVGFDFCRFIANYDGLVSLKLRWMLRQAKDQGAAAVLAQPQQRALAQAEGTVIGPNPPTEVPAAAEVGNAAAPRTEKA
ncbi:MAG: glycosyltransferase family 2 protein, partial [Rhodospirillales bacterium]|nr:glycosyltransferase family 2 protein [Rhodospirillales bacterium]